MLRRGADDQALDEQIDSQLDVLDAQLDELDARLEQGQLHIEMETHKQIAALRRKYQVAGEEWARVTSSFLPRWGPSLVPMR